MAKLTTTDVYGIFTAHSNVVIKGNIGIANTSILPLIPSSGYNTLYIKQDNILYMMRAGGNETPVNSPYINGFTNQYFDNTISFVNGTRTLTITPTSSTFQIYSAGLVYNKTVDSIIIANTEGSHYIYYNSLGVISESVNPSGSQIYSIILNSCFVAYVYWDATNSTALIVGKEQHGIIMDGQDHVYDHIYFRTQWNTGLSPNTISADGSGNVNASAQFGMDAGIIQDEDLQHTIQAVSSSTGLPIFYNSGAGQFLRSGTQAGYSVLNTGTGRLAYNNINAGGAGVWGLTESNNNDFVLYHIFTTNSIVNPIISVMGQSGYTTLANARAGANVELDALVLSFPAPEFKAIATIIFETSNSYSNAVKARIRSISTGVNFVDWRATKTTPGSVVGSTYVLPIATTTILGGVKQGANITIATDGTISTSASGYILPVATASVLGGVKQGSNISIAADGTISSTGGSGSSSGLGINYITNPSAETTVAGWNTYNDGATSIPVDGTGGVSSLTLVRNTTAPLFNIADFLISKPAVNCLGHGFSTDMVIDRGSLSAEETISLSYQVSSNYVDNDIVVYVYDITNNVLIPTSVKNISGYSGAITGFIATFTPNGTSSFYRLIFHVATSNANAYSFEFDNVSVGPKEVTSGSAIGNWTPYTPNITNIGTTSSSYAAWRRVGDSMEIYNFARASGAGAAGTLTFNLPPGYQIDMAKLNLAAGTSGNVLGAGTWYNNTLVHSLATFVVSSTGIGMYKQNVIAALQGNDLANGHEIGIMVTVPIQGWGSNINLISDFTEYASNDGSGGTAAGAIYTTGMVSGPNGCVLPAVASTSLNSTTSYKVSFSTPIKTTDKLSIELMYNGSWQPLETMGASISPELYLYNAIYGMGIWPGFVDANSLYIQFGNYGRLSNGSTYAAQGATWASINTLYRWRVRKVSNGNMAESQVLDAQIGNWTSYTPTISGLGSGSVVGATASWRRVGSSMEIQCQWTKDGTAGTGASYVGLSLPAGYSWQMVAQGDNYGIIQNIATGVCYTGLAISDMTQVYIRNAGSAITGATAPANQGWSYHLSLPIAGWTSNINLVTDFTEYASNSNVANSTEGSYTPANDVYGPQGSAIPAFTIAAGSSTRYVKFNNPVKASDVLAVEVDSGSGSWENVNNRLIGNLSQNTYNYGLQILRTVGNNVVTIYWGLGGYQTNATTFGGVPTAPWSNINPTWKWRVRKVSNGNMAEDQMLDAQIGNWTPYTPTMGAVTTAPSLVGFASKGVWRRVGSSIEVRMSLIWASSTAGTGYYYFTLPSGLTLDTSSGMLNSSAYIHPHLGKANIASAGTGGGFEGAVSWVDSAIIPANAVAIVKPGVAFTNPANETTAWDWWGGSNPVNASNALSVSLTFSVPISGWTSNINLASDFTEYAYNTGSSTTTDDDTSFAYGPDGTPFVATTVSHNLRVRFTKPIKSTDIIIIEIKYANGNGEWVPLNGEENQSGISSLVYQNGVKYGFGRYANVSLPSTDIYVVYGTYGYPSGTYGAAGLAWSNYTSHKWRVRKISNGNMAESHPNPISGGAWSNDTTYNLGDVVSYGGAVYICIQPNSNFQPDLNPTSWTLNMSTGNAIGNWNLYTPVVTSTGGGAIPANITSNGRWRRVGSSMEIQYSYTQGAGTTGTGNYLVSIPSNYTIDFSNNTISGAIGTAYMYSSPQELIGQNYLDTVYPSSFKIYGSLATGVHSYWSSSCGALSNNPVSVSGNLLIPIVGWGSNINLVSDFTEYAFNSSATTTSDTTSFGYGPDGALIQSFAPGALLTVNKRVQFLTPVKPTDRIILEVNLGSGGWITPSDRGINFQTYGYPSPTNYTGVSFYAINSTQWDVSFYNTYSGTGAWSSASGWRWRVRKVSNGNLAEAITGATGGGAWNDFTTYNIGDIVSYNDTTFIALLASTNIAPSNTTYWEQSRVGGAAIGNWTNFTPSINMTNFAGTWQKSRWMRNGSNMMLDLIYKASGVATGTIIFNLSTLLTGMGYTIDSAGFNPHAISALKAGSYVASGAAYDGNVFYIPSGAAFAATVPFTWAANDAIYMLITVPVSGWGSNINLVSDFTEYASNTNSTNASSDLTSFTNNLAGSLIPNGAVGTGYNRRVRFNTAIKTTDSIIVEIYNNFEWLPAAGNFPRVLANTTVYGIETDNTANLTDVDVLFASGGSSSYSAATYGANGYAWSNYSTWKWRVRKVSNGNMAEALVLDAQIGNWTSYTPTWASLGTQIANIGKWRRSGSNMEIYAWTQVSTAGAAADISFSLPPGYVIDGSNLPSAQAAAVSVGTMTWYNASTVANKTVYASTSGAANTIVSYQFLGNTTANNHQIGAYVSVPIAGWNSNINLVSDFTEYGSNSNMGDVSDSTSFVYGSGSSLPSVSYSTVRDKSVAFRQIINPTDVLTLEIDYDGNGNWIDLSSMSGAAIAIRNISQFTFQSPNYYGLGILSKTANTVIVRFAQYSYPSSTYGAAGNAWSATTGVGRWRVRKIANGNMAEAPANTTGGSSWNSTIRYSPGDLITYNNDVYNAVIASTGIQPSLTDNTYWQLTSTSGNAIGNWTSYAPTVGGGLTTFALGPVGKWRRVGTNMEIGFWFSSSSSGTGAIMQVSIPPGYTPDYSSIARGSINANGSAIGSGYYYSVASGVIHCSFQIASAIGSFITVYKTGVGTSIVGTDIGNGGELNGIVSIPIVGWGSNINLVSDFTEYAYNTSSNTTTSDTTSFAYGPEGALIGSITVALQRRVRFKNVIKPTDKIELEIYNPTNGMWSNNTALIPTNYTFVNSSGGTALSGINSTDVDAQFWGLPYGNTSAPWSGFSGYKWRVRKISSGNMAEVPSVPHCEVYGNSGQTIATATPTTVIFSTIQVDTNGAYNTGTGIYTTPMAGYYQVNVSFMYQYTTWVVSPDTFITVSGGSLAKALDYKTVPANGVNSYVNMAGSTTIKCAQGAQISAAIYQSSGSNKQIFPNTTGNYIFMDITWIGK